MEKNNKYLRYRGIRGWVAAEVIEDTEEKFECGTPFEIAGLGEVSKETEASSEPYHYDNVVAGSNDTVGNDTVTFSCAAIPDEPYAKITGQYYDEASGMLVEGGAEQKYFAVGYITKKNDGSEMFVWRLKGKFNIPGVTSATEENGGGEGNGQEVTYTGCDTIHKFTTKDGKTKGRRAINLPAGKSMTEEEFFASVQTPETIADVQTV